MFKEYLKRFAICILSLALYGVGCVLGVKAGAAGTNAWGTLSLGIAGITGITYGTSTFLIGMAVILIDLLGRGKLGFGTLLNATLVPFFSDLYLTLLSSIPEASTAFAGAICTLAGQTVISFATILYMSPALGCGPRDTLMIIIGKRFPKAPIGTVKFCLEVIVLLVGFFLGAPLGIGTVLIMVLQASIFQFACKVTHYEPRSVKHENIIDTCRRMFRKAPQT
jgi:uncharacterized membrane protein YczE